jgi:hypothetical protein
MSLQSSDIQGHLALQRLSKRQHALSVLQSSDGPGKWTVELVVVAVAAALACFLLERASVPESVASVLAWIGAAVSIFGIHHNQRPDGMQHAGAALHVTLDRRDG